MYQQHLRAEELTTHVSAIAGVLDVRLQLEESGSIVSLGWIGIHHVHWRCFKT
jgi:hypothetical protein